MTTGNRLLLDTNAAIDMLNQMPAISDVLRSYESLLLPLNALAELEFGARKSGKPHQNLQAIERLLAATRLLLPNRTTATVYGELRTTLRRKGRPIPAEDLWIAALARQHSLPLLTRDAHFREVDGLALVTW